MLSLTCNLFAARVVIWVKHIVMTRIILATVTFVISSTFAYSQQSDDEVTQLIVRNDSLFWKAYNTCDIAGMTTLFRDDVEFYHDKGGPSYGVDTLMSIIKKNLCSKSDFRLRREPVKDSYRVFTLRSNNQVYGAIQSGEHVFYIVEKGKEHLDGLAKFTHLWLLKDGKWKMSRVLSYDHGPAPKTNGRE